MQIGLTFSNCSGSGAEISPEASLASKASMSRSFFLEEMQSKILRKNTNLHQRIKPKADCNQEQFDSKKDL